MAREKNPVKTSVFWIKNYKLGLHKVFPSYGRSLPPSKENIKHFKTLNSLIFSNFVGHFSPFFRSGCGYGSTELVRSGSNPESDPKSGSETLVKTGIKYK